MFHSVFSTETPSGQNDQTQQLLLTLQNQQLFQNNINVQDILNKLVIKDGKLYISNNQNGAQQQDQQEAKVFISSIDVQGLQMQYDNLMQQYLQTPNGQEYQDARAKSALKHGMDAFNNPTGANIPTEKDPAKQKQVDQVLQQIQKEFMNLESLRLAFDQVNPIPDGNSQDGGKTLSEDDSINSAKKGLWDRPLDSADEGPPVEWQVPLDSKGVAPPVEEIEEHRTPLQSSSSSSRTSESMQQQTGSLPSRDAVKTHQGGNGAATQEQNGKKPAGGHIGDEHSQLMQQEIIEIIKTQQEEGGHQQQLQRQQELLQRQFERHEQLMQQAARNQAAQREFQDKPSKNEKKDGNW